MNDFVFFLLLASDFSILLKWDMSQRVWVLTLIFSCLHCFSMIFHLSRLLFYLLCFQFLLCAILDCFLCLALLLSNCMYLLSAIFFFLYLFFYLLFLSSKYYSHIFCLFQKLANWKEPSDQTHITITKTLSQTLINNGDIVYCCVLNILFVFTRIKRKGKIRRIEESVAYHFFLIGIHSMQGWRATTRHGVARKRSTKRLKHTGNFFTKNLQLIGVC